MSKVAKIGANCLKKIISKDSSLTKRKKYQFYRRIFSKEKVKLTPKVVLNESCPTANEFEDMKLRLQGQKWQYTVTVKLGGGGSPRHTPPLP